MAKILQFDNKSIFADIAQEVATLRVPSMVGSSVTLTLDNNSGLANNDYVLIEDVSTPRAEIAKINAAVSAGTTIQVDTLKFPHNVGVKIYKIGYNQIKFFHSATSGGSKSLLGSATDLDVDDEFTEYVDSTNSSGYAFFALFNSTTSAVSDYSSAYPYSLLTLSSKSKIRDFVKKFYKKPIDDETFSFLTDSAEDEIYAVRLWKFRERSMSFNTVISQQAYSFESISLSDYGTFIYASFDSIYPLQFLTIKEHKSLNEGSAVGSAIPQFIFEFADSFYLTPTPSSVGEVNILYYGNSVGFSEETTETQIEMPQAVAFRILQDLWSMDDPKKAQYWENRYLQIVSVMKSKEREQVGRFAPLTDSRLTKRRVNNSIEYPSITV